MIVHYPKTKEGKRELAERVANVHADMVNQQIQKLSCPSEQKIQLLDSILKSVSNKKQENIQGTLTFLWYIIKVPWYFVVEWDLLQPKIMSRIVNEGVLGTANGGVGDLHLIWTLGL